MSLWTVHRPATPGSPGLRFWSRLARLVWLLVGGGGRDAAGNPSLAVNERGHAPVVWVRTGGDGSRIVGRSYTSGR